MPYAMVEEVVEEELGAPPEAIFDYFSPVPIASASIGQVHMAHRGSEELVVKVQYPGVAKAIESDLRNAALLVAPRRGSLQRLMADMLGKVDTSALIEELRERITEELDYRIEAANQQHFADLWRDDPHIDVPAVVPELSTRRVLTSEYVDGLRWSAAVEQPQALRDQWGTAMARFQLVSLFGKGVTNLDPHPGNYLFHDDGHVTFLDYGACQRFDEDQLTRLGGLAIAGIADTEEGVLDALVRMGLLRHTDGIDPDLVVRPIRLAMEPATTEPQPFDFRPDFVSKQVWQALDFRIGRDKIRMLRGPRRPRRGADDPAHRPRDRRDPEPARRDRALPGRHRRGLRGPPRLHPVLHARADPSSRARGGGQREASQSRPRRAPWPPL